MEDAQSGGDGRTVAQMPDTPSVATLFSVDSTVVFQ